jgi:hypothetical protein
MTTNSQSSVLMKALGVVVGFIACFLLYYGATMLLMVPGYPGEGYFAKGRVIYGLLPMVTSLVLILLCAWLWSRASGTDFFLCVWRTICWLVGSVVAFWLVLFVIAGFRQS